MPRTIASLALLLLCCTPLTAETGNAWATFRGPNADGHADVRLPDGPLRFEQRWIHKLGNGYSGVAVGGGLLVTAAADGERDVVVALDPETGEERWRYDLAPTYKGHDGSHDGPIATPAIADGRVFMLGPWGHLAAISLADGKALWTLHLVDDLAAEKPHYGYSSSPAVVDGVVVVPDGGSEEKPGRVAAFDAATGEVLWRNHEDLFFCQSAVAVTIAGRRQVAVLGVGKVAGLDPKNGDVLWEHSHGGGMSAMGAGTSSPMPMGGGRFHVKHGADSTVVLGVRVEEGGQKVDVLQEMSGLSKSYSPAAVGGDTLYGFTGRFLSAADPGTGETLWRSRQPGDGSLVNVGGHLVVLTKKGTLHLGPASRDGWQEMARHDLFEDSLAWTPPSVAGNSLYLRSLGEVARVDIVAASAPVAVAEAALPAALGDLAAQVAEAGDTATDGSKARQAAVAGFLRGKELPLIDGEDVLFLWHGPADDVAVAGDMIGMRREEPMRRLEGTDLWWWQTRIDPRARLSYVFMVNDEVRVDPSHFRRVQATVLGPDMNWQREALEMSWFAGPEWPGWRTSASATRGRLETFEVTLPKPEGAPDDAPAPAPATLHVWLPPGYDGDAEARYPVVYVHHPRARTDGDWPETLDRVVGRTVEPLIAVFLPRMRRLADVYSSTVVPAVDGRYRTRADRDSRANVGMGWPANAAVGLTFDDPDVFGRLAVQSFYALDGSMQETEGAIGEQTASSTPLRIYLEWGKWDLISPHEEMNMRASSRWLDGFLRERGWTPVGGEVLDSTDFASWRNRTDLLLEALFPLDGTAPPADLDRWSAAP